MKKKKIEKKPLSLETKKKIVIGVGITVLLIVIFVGGFFLFQNIKPNEEPTTDNPIPNLISPEEATDLYETLNCTGAMVWDVKVGEKVEIDKIENYATACKTDNYYSKMIGYTYDEENNVVLNVNVLKKVDNSLYQLDDTIVGEYKEDTLDVSLESGTTYIYTYTKDGDGYKLVKVELMDKKGPEETPEETP